MLGAGIGETLNAVFAVLSAQGSELGIAGLSSGLTEVEHFLKTTHTDDNVHNKQLQAEKPGLSDHMGGKVKQEVCLDEAIDGHCTDKQCWRKHDAKSIEQYKAALGMKCWEKKKQWWKRICARQKLSTPKADDTDKAEADTDKTEINKGLEHKVACTCCTAAALKAKVDHT